MKHEYNYVFMRPRNALGQSELSSTAVDLFVRRHFEKVNRNVNLQQDDEIVVGQLRYCVYGEESRTLLYELIIVRPDADSLGHVTVVYKDRKSNPIRIEHLPFQDEQGLEILLYAIDNHHNDADVEFSDQGKEQKIIEVQVWVAQRLARVVLDRAGELRISKEPIATYGIADSTYRISRHNNSISLFEQTQMSMRANSVLSIEPLDTKDSYGTHFAAFQFRKGTVDNVDGPLDLSEGIASGGDGNPALLPHVLTRLVQTVRDVEHILAEQQQS